MAYINNELKNGALKTWQARQDRELVRKTLDDAWQLTPEVRAWMDQAWGKALDQQNALTGTPIVAAKDFPVAYARRTGEEIKVEAATLEQALGEWHEEYYPYEATQQRAFLKKMQLALHAKQPAILIWNVDFAAWKQTPGDLQGSFSLTQLNAAAEPGRQGAHMSALEDYAAVTSEFGELKAGVTLDPTKPEDAAKLAAALQDDTQITLIRIKNSWGSKRADGAYPAADFLGYNDLYMDYLNGPITWCSEPDAQGQRSCNWTTRPLTGLVLPPI